MNVADNTIVNAFVHLTNYFASNIDPPCEKINTLTDLWEKQGRMIASLMQCDRLTFQTSAVFYEVLHRKIRLVNGELATALEPEAAAAGDLFEICKFYALHLEYLRKDHSEMLTEVLERAANMTGFNSTALLEMFAFFDKLYSEDCADEWWSCLRSDNIEVLDGLSTPKRSQFETSFATPTATARRLRTAASTARRSPIADAVDSPTMKFMRSERELKQAKKKLSDLHGTLDELETENQKLTVEKRELKLLISQLKGNAEGNKDSAETAEKVAIELSTKLEAKSAEVEALSQKLEECRTTIRSNHRHLEDLEAEKETLTSKLETVSRDRELCMKQMRDLRNSNELEFSSWREKEQNLNEQLRVAEARLADVVEQFNSMQEMKEALASENHRLNQAIDEMNTQSSRHMQKEELAQTALREYKEQHQNTLQKIQEQHAERMKMLEATKDRLQKELQDERNEKKSLQDLLNDLNEKALSQDKQAHGQNEEALSIRACLETAKRRIEHLEIDVKAKEAAISVQEQQSARMSEIWLNEKTIREKLSEQFDSKYSLLSEELAKEQKKVADLGESLKKSQEKYEKEVGDKQEEIEQRDVTIKKLSEELEELQKTWEDDKEKLRYLSARMKQFDAPMDPRPSSCDSLADLIAKENVDEQDEELMKIMADTPRKSVAFSVDLDAEKTMKEAPFGFRSGTNNPRQSICSMNEETFDRTSMSRSSIRSDTLTVASMSSTFKTPFTPAGTTKERVGVLTERNQKVKPHLQSSYVTEMGNVGSPSADEENVRKGAPKKTKRRESFVSNIFRRN